MFMLAFLPSEIGSLKIHKINKFELLFNLMKKKHPKDYQVFHYISTSIVPKILIRVKAISRFVVSYIYQICDCCFSAFKFRIEDHKITIKFTLIRYI